MWFPVIYIWKTKGRNTANKLNTVLSPFRGGGLRTFFTRIATCMLVGVFILLVDISNQKIHVRVTGRENLSAWYV